MTQLLPHEYSKIMVVRCAESEPNWSAGRLIEPLLVGFLNWLDAGRVFELVVTV